MNRRTLPLIITLAALAGTCRATAAEEKSSKLTTVSLRKMADGLHAVIAADQEAYVRQGGSPRGPRSAATNSATGAAAPSHAALLRIAAQNIQTSGAEFSYTLRSLQPINANNGPQTEMEQTGLAAVVKQPEEPFYADEQLGGRSYFTAVYALRATSASCIECHNQHPQSPKHDLKLGAVMGAVVIRLPLEF